MTETIIPDSMEAFNHDNPIWQNYSGPTYQHRQTAQAILLTKDLEFDYNGKRLKYAAGGYLVREKAVNYEDPTKAEFWIVYLPADRFNSVYELPTEKTHGT